MDDGGCAYPHDAGQNPGDFCRAEAGMSLWEYYVGQTLAGLDGETLGILRDVAKDEGVPAAHAVGQWCCDIADAVMAAIRRRESPAVPPEAEKIAELERALRRRDGWWTCDGCDTEFGPEQPNVGHECDLCPACAESCRKAESTSPPANGSTPE